MAPSRMVDAPDQTRNGDKVLDQPSFKATATRKPKSQARPEVLNTVLARETATASRDDDPAAHAAFLSDPIRASAETGRSTTNDTIQELAKHMEVQNVSLQETRAALRNVEHEIIETRRDVLTYCGGRSASLQVGISNDISLQVSKDLDRVGQLVEKIDDTLTPVPGGMARIEEIVGDIEDAVTGDYGLREIHDMVDEVKDQLDSSLGQQGIQHEVLENTIDRAMLEIRKEMMTYWVAANERFNRVEDKLDRLYTMLQHRLPTGQ